MKTEQAAQHTPGMKVQIVGGHYAVVDHNGNFYAKTYSSADARLIAASPELLEACRALVSELSDIMTAYPRLDWTAAGTVKIRNKAQAAIAKATQP